MSWKINEAFRFQAANFTTLAYKFCCRVSEVGFHMNRIVDGCWERMNVLMEVVFHLNWLIVLIRCYSGDHCPKIIGSSRTTIAMQSLSILILQKALIFRPETTTISPSKWPNNLKATLLQWSPFHLNASELCTALGFVSCTR